MPRSDPPRPRPARPRLDKAAILELFQARFYRRFSGRLGGPFDGYPNWLDGWGLNKRRSKRGEDLEREPVEPPRPKNLSGGAAAELEFDE